MYIFIYRGMKKLDKKVIKKIKHILCLKTNREVLELIRIKKIKIK